METLTSHHVASRVAPAHADPAQPSPALAPATGTEGPTAPGQPRAPLAGEQRKPGTRSSPKPTGTGALFQGHEPPLDIKQAAAFLNVAERWMRRAVGERRIAYYKVGGHVRFAVEDLRAYLLSSRVEPADGVDSSDGGVRGQSWSYRSQRSASRARRVDPQPRPSAPRRR